LRNLFHRRAIEPVLAEYARRRLEQRIAPVFGDDLGPGWLSMTVHSVK